MMMRNSLLALLVCLCAPGCGVQPTQARLLGVVPDSISYVEVSGRNQPYALVWRQGVANLWCRGGVIYNCGIPVKQGVVKASIVFRAENAQQGQPWVFSSFAASDTVIASATAVCGPAGADTMDGSWSATFKTPCGLQTVGAAFTLVRVP